MKTTEQVADLNGYNIIFCDSRGNLQKEKQCINVLRSHQVDGVLLAPVSKATSHLNIPKQCTILGRISGENNGPPTKIGLEPTLVVRESTRKGQGL